MSSPVIVSTLYIANATPRDSGNYTCALGDVATGAVMVHILDGKDGKYELTHLLYLIIFLTMMIKIII